MNQQLKTNLSLVCSLAVCLLCFSVTQGQTCLQDCQTFVQRPCEDLANLDKAFCDGQANYDYDQCFFNAYTEEIDGCLIWCQATSPTPMGGLNACYYYCEHDIGGTLLEQCVQIRDLDLEFCDTKLASDMLTCLVRLGDCALTCE